MRNMKWLLAAGLIAATTAACTTDSGYYPSTSGYYPSTAYNNAGYNRGYQTNNGYYQQPTTAYYPNNSGYYSNRSSSYNSGYNTAQRRGPNGDYDRDGIPNKYDRDANGDGVRDRYQR